MWLTFLLLIMRGTIWHVLQLDWSIFNFPVHEGGLSAPKGVSVYFSYGIPETVEWVHLGESFYTGEIKITGGAIPCPACSQVNRPMEITWLGCLTPGLMHYCINTNLSIEFFDSFSDALYQLISDLLFTHNIVWCYTRLAWVDKPSPCDTPCCCGYVTILIYKNRTEMKTNVYYCCDLHVLHQLSECFSSDYKIETNEKD